MKIKNGLVNIINLTVISSLRKYIVLGKEQKELLAGKPVLESKVGTKFEL